LELRLLSALVSATRIEISAGGPGEPGWPRPAGNGAPIVASQRHEPPPACIRRPRVGRDKAESLTEAGENKVRSYRTLIRAVARTGTLLLMAAPASAYAEVQPAHSIGRGLSASAILSRSSNEMKRLGSAKTRTIAEYICTCHDSPGPRTIITRTVERESRSSNSDAFSSNAIYETGLDRFLARERVVYIPGNGAAFRVGGRWQCLWPPQPAPSIPTWVGQLSRPKLGLSGLPQPSTLGAGRVHDIPVWTVALPEPSGRARLWISKRNFALLRITSRSIDRVSSSLTVSARLLENYTDLGKKMHIRLPSACARSTSQEPPKHKRQERPGLPGAATGAARLAAGARKP